MNPGFILQNLVLLVAFEKSAHKLKLIFITSKYSKLKGKYIDATMYVYNIIVLGWEEIK